MFSHDPGPSRGYVYLAGRSAIAARWQSGHAAACKAVYAGSIPTPASTRLIERIGRSDELLGFVRFDVSLSPPPRW